MSIDVEKAFKNLSENAFDFLKKSAAEFENDPKSSVINFYAAIELLLKARLLREHWSLVITDIRKASIAKFEQGDFHSVTLSEAQDRLKNIVGSPIPEKTFECLKELARYRNKVMHFYHDDWDNKKEEVALKECKAWFYIGSLLLESWQDCFGEYQNSVSEINKLMHNQNSFLEKKFQHLGSIIAKREEGGSVFHSCPTCKFLSLEEAVADEEGFEELGCLVCYEKERSLRIDCPKCKKSKFFIEDLDGGVAPPCKHDVMTSDVIACLEQPTHQKGRPHGVATCIECGEESVFCYGDSDWRCAQCFAHYDESEVNECKYCYELTTVDEELSHAWGCRRSGCYGWDGSAERI